MGLIKIFNPTTTSFSSLGLGTLKDFKNNPQITEVLNGQYTLEFEYAKDGQFSEYLQENYIIVANKQPFRIWQVEKDMSTIKVLAKHIFFDLSKNFLEDVAPTKLTAQNALRWILQRTQEENNFSVIGNCTELASARYVRQTVTDAIFNTDNNLLNVFGGELEYDKYNITIHKKRGIDSNFSIRYGKNLSGIDFKLDFSTVVTKIMPVGSNGLLIDEKYIESPLINNYFTPIYQKIEFSNIGVDENTTEEEAKEKLINATNQLIEEGIDLPQVSIKVDFIELAKCTEYKSLSNLETCHLGDTVTAIIPTLNINVKTRIIKTVYDCLLDRIVNLELGSATPNFVVSQKSTTNKLKSTIVNSEKSVIEQAQENAKALINHPFNGNVVIDEDSGCLYLIDTDNVETAQNVWKWSLGGLGFSSTGVNGTYRTAITQDGHIVADFIVTGKLGTNVIEGYNQLLLDVSNSKDKVAQLSLDVDSLRSEIGDVTDVTQSKETIDAYLLFEDINASEPLNINIHPTTKDISYLIISSNMLITENLELPNRILQFKNIVTNEIFNYEIPDDLFIFNGTYDELIMSYDSNEDKIIVQKIKRIQLNPDGTKTILEEPQTISFPNINMPLTTGDYEVRLLDYSKAYLFVRLMSQNMYTSQFTTKTELKSSIVQTKESITLDVDKKISNVNGTVEELESKIEQTASSITSSVSATYSTKSETEQAKSEAIASANNDTNDKLQDYSTTMQMNSAIEQTASSITSIVSQNYATKNELSTVETNLSSAISQTSSSITAEVNRAKTAENTISGQVELKINKDDLVSEFNAKANVITITSDFFRLAANGHITATGGFIGGWNLTSTKIYMNDTGMSSNTSDYAFWAGETNGSNGSSSSNAKFKVGHDGSLISTSANITGHINATSGSFKGSVTATSGSFTGTVNATDGSFNGTITSRNGEIGGWNITSNKLYGIAGSGKNVQWSIAPYGVRNDTAGNSYYWGNIVSLSDKKVKNTINDIDEKYELFFDNLKPKTFYFNENILDDKKHIGFIAQDILKNEKLINEELSMIDKSPEGYYNLDKREIIALNTWQIQKLKKQLKDQQEIIETMQQEIQNLKEKLL